MSFAYWLRVSELVAFAAWAPVVLGCIAWFAFPKNPQGEPGGAQPPDAETFGIESDEPLPNDPEYRPFEDEPGEGRRFYE